MTVCERQHGTAWQSSSCFAVYALAVAKATKADIYHPASSVTVPVSDGDGDEKRVKSICTALMRSEVDPSATIANEHTR